MSRVRLFPYPRLGELVEWSPIEISIDGEGVGIEELAHKWDHNSKIQLMVSFEAPTSDVKRIGADDLTLTLKASCLETAITKTVQVPLLESSGRVHGSATVQIAGQDLAQRIDVHAKVIAPFGTEKWLSRRILAQRPIEAINLESDLSGFPTSAISFSENYRADAPWALDITATDLTDPFAHSIRLSLNIDRPIIKEFIRNTTSRSVRTSLDASILRVLVLTARRLADEAGSDDQVRSAIEESPDSITAAADKACRDYLRAPLIHVLNILRRQPEEFETLVNSAFNTLEVVR